MRFIGSTDRFERGIVSEVTLTFTDSTELPVLRRARGRGTVAEMFFSKDRLPAYTPTVEQCAEPLFLGNHFSIIVKKNLDLVKKDNQKISESKFENKATVYYY